MTCVRCKINNFFAVSFICAGGLSRSYERLVGAVFSGNHSGLCGDALRGSQHNLNRDDRVETLQRGLRSVQRGERDPARFLYQLFWEGMGVIRFMRRSPFFPFLFFCVYSCQNTYDLALGTFLHHAVTQDHGKTRVGALIRFRQGMAEKVVQGLVPSRSAVTDHKLGECRNDKLRQSRAAWCWMQSRIPRCWNLDQPGAPL